MSASYPITKASPMFTKPYDAIVVTYPSATQEVYTTMIGGTSGTAQEVLTINYTDSTKANISNMAVV